MTGQNETLDGVDPKRTAHFWQAEIRHTRLTLIGACSNEATHGTMDALRWSRVLRTEYRIHLTHSTSRAGK